MKMWAEQQSAARDRLCEEIDPHLGASGRLMLEAIVSGQQDAEKLAEMSKGQLRDKIPQLQLALEGRVTEHHRFLLGPLLDYLRRIQDRHRGGGDRQTQPPF
jgi:hypothetical protein